MMVEWMTYLNPLIHMLLSSSVGHININNHSVVLKQKQYCQSFSKLNFRFTSTSGNYTWLISLNGITFIFSFKFIVFSCYIFIIAFLKSTIKYRFGNLDFWNNLIYYTNFSIKPSITKSLNYTYCNA